MSNIELENLKNEYLEKLHEVDNGSRNVLIFTEQKPDGIVNLLKRKIKEIKELEKNVILIKYSSEIKKDTLKKIFEYFILFSSFKKNENIPTDENNVKLTYFKNFFRESI